MDKATLLEKIKSGSYTKEQLNAWINCLPGTVANRKPSRSKKGDVYMHPVFKHPYVLLEKKKSYWLCALLTTEGECSEILEPCRSRFFENNFFTRTLFTTVTPVGTYGNVFDNPKQLKEVLSQLKQIMN